MVGCADYPGNASGMSGRGYSVEDEPDNSDPPDLAEARRMKADRRVAYCTRPPSSAPTIYANRAAPPPKSMVSHPAHSQCWATNLDLAAPIPKKAAAVRRQLQT